MILRVLLKCKHHVSSSSNFIRCSFSRCSTSPLNERVEKTHPNPPHEFDLRQDQVTHVKDVQKLVPHGHRVNNPRVIPSVNRSQVLADTGPDQIFTTTVTNSSNANELLWKYRERPSGADTTVYWSRLSKYRLTGLVVATTLAGFTMGCDPMSSNLTLLTATLGWNSVDIIFSCSTKSVLGNTFRFTNGSNKIKTSSCWSNHSPSCVHFCFRHRSSWPFNPCFEC